MQPGYTEKTFASTAKVRSITKLNKVKFKKLIVILNGLKILFNQWH